jgi:very-short-patch-repair endonuclease
MKKISPRLIEYSRHLRKNQSDAEMRLWKFLRSGNFLGLRFRRQKIIGPYIVDFFCSKARLIVELDGGQHSEPEAIKYDLARTKFFKSNGYKVIRFWNKEFLSNTQGALEVIWRAVIQQSPPSPQPSPASGRGRSAANN